ncbi:uncharacterized protein LOC110336511 [Mus pahari]|uniref:uncharacterized protein LOC110336511 n=1 Tax=Mus pahari TaxID=10093 RepID=UPI000A3141E6|nr:uncharacterized protein LOC110336511 [Mus pahari]
MPRGRAPPRVSWADARRAPGAAEMRPSRWLRASVQTTAPPPAPPPPSLLRHSRRKTCEQPPDRAPLAERAAAWRRDRNIWRRRLRARALGTAAWGRGAEYARARALPSTRSRPSRSRVAMLRVRNSPAQCVLDVSHAHRTVHSGWQPACSSARVLQSRTLGPASSAGVATSAAAAWPIVGEEGPDNTGWAGPRPSLAPEPRWRG